MTTARDIAAMLARDAEAVAKLLLPNGKREGHEWRAGSTDGEAGKSLGVHLTGEKTGVWGDFATGESGDLLDLWAACRSIPLAQAIAEAKAHLGVRDPEFAGHRRQEYRRPERPKCQAPRDGSPVLDYLTRERGLTPDTLAAYRVAERGREIVLPSLRDGDLIAVKYLGLDRPNGKKQVRVEKDTQPCLFGWQAIPDNAREVTITEGEVDAMSMFQLGAPALSVPFGGGSGAKQQWIEHEFQHLERFDTIYLALDADGPGQEATAVIAERLGRERCRVVTMPAPHKDANDLLRAGWTPTQARNLLTAARTLDPDELRSAALYADDVVREFYPADEAERGFLPPWRKLHGLLLFRPGEVSVLAGVNGHGKSEIAGHLTLGALSQGERACIASMEFKPVKWLRRLTRQAAAMAVPSEPYIRAIHRWYADRLWVFDVVGTAKADRILDVFAYARRRYGIRLFVIDNLAKCGFAEDDYNGQKRFVDRLTDFAKEHDAHVMLVAHTRKGESEDKPPGKFDVKGTGGISDMTDTLLLCWRNKKREEAIRRAEADGIPAPLEIQEQPGAMLICAKQRNGDDEPRAALWFDRESHQFLSKPDGRPWRYVNYSIADDYTQGEIEQAEADDLEGVR